MGLGLFTAEAIVRTYGGRIEAANRTDGPGARFSMEFPVAEAQAAETPKAEGAEKGDTHA